MTDRQILFSGPMIRALLAGRKNQTRRVIQPFAYDPALRPGMAGYRPAPLGLWQVDSGGPYFLPRYAVGDRLWVREAVRFCSQMDGIKPDNLSPHEPRLYVADDYLHKPTCMMIKEGRIRPAIHMPRWASRLTLTVTDVRVERLQDISEADAWAEGCKPGALNDRGEPFPADEPAPDGKSEIGWDCARDWYADLWDSIHGPGAWDANPWVAAYTFTVQRRNIDQIGVLE